MSAELARTRLHMALTEVAGQIAQRQPAKVIALKTGLSERHARALQKREHGIGAAALFLLLQEDPEGLAWAIELLRVGPDSESGRRLMAAIDRRLGEDGTP